MSLFFLAMSSFSLRRSRPSFPSSSLRFANRASSFALRVFASSIDGFPRIEMWWASEIHFFRKSRH